MALSAQQRDYAEALLCQVHWYAALPEAAQLQLLAAAEWRALPGGDVLFYEGEPADAAYLVLSGSLGAFRASSEGPERIGLMVLGESVGELGVLTQRPRAATVRALRDSEVLRLSATDLEALGASCPEALLVLSRLALRRLSEPHNAEIRATPPRTFALLPQCPGIDLRGFAATLATTLGRYGRVQILTEADRGQSAAVYHAMEKEARFLFYLADGSDPGWRDLCRRQSDARLYLGRAGDAPVPPGELLEPPGDDAFSAPAHLILLHGRTFTFGAGGRWQRLRPRAQLHHVRDDADIARIGRLLCGQSLGLVLSGGGARGFAHLGVIKALQEAGFAIDAVGGTSIGAVIGAGLAAGWSLEEMLEKFRRCFYDTNPLSDYTLPLIALVAGRKAARLLRETFGEREIEDLVLPYFCVSANLTQGKVALHRQGKLWQWLRASIAIPGILPPVLFGGEVFVDGGVIDNLPVGFMRYLHQGESIAVDIGGDHAVGAMLDEFQLPSLPRLVLEWVQMRRRPSLAQILLRAGMVNSASTALDARAQCSLLLTPPLEDVGLLEWHSFYRAIDRGYQHTRRIVGGYGDTLSDEVPALL